MKLYTEEEIVNFLNKEFADEINAETFMENLTPIELPSHHEIWEEAIKEELNQRRYDFMRGADFVRNKIQGL
jgi:hypothetical protein